MNDERSRPARFARWIRARRRCAPAIIALALTAAQCPQKPEARAGTDTAAQPATPHPSESDQDRMARLEREARALAKADGCTSADQCRAAPVGERPCGGPRDYVVYCARTTDSAGLYRKLAELRQAEMAYNKKSGAMSTCEFRTSPEVGISSGSCKAR